MADLTVEPLKDMKSLLETDIPNLPKALLKHPEKRSNSNFKILRDKSGNVEKIELVEKPTKTLVCHDMKGGYLEDKFIHGCQDLDQEPYIFTHWHLIDIFVYFSHHFITIPPLGWIEAAHKNGVQILGKPPFVGIFAFDLTEFRPKLFAFFPQHCQIPILAQTRAKPNFGRIFCPPLVCLFF